MRKRLENLKPMTSHRLILKLSPRARSARIGVLLGCLILSIGSLGYWLIEGWSLADSVFMTVITLSTVGFSEVHPLSPTGRMFTVALILAGVSCASYFLTTMVGLVVEGEFQRLRGMRKMQQRIEKLTGHTIICGCGRLGRIVIKELLDSKQPVVVVENGVEGIAWLERYGAPYVQGSAYDDETLFAAGIERARTLLALLPKDVDNVYATLCARTLNPQLEIIARTEEENGETKLLRAGANQVLAPYRVTGSRIVQRLIRPNVTDFLEFAVGKSGTSVAIEEVVVPKNSPLAGKTLEESELRNRAGVVIAAFITRAGETIFNPGAKSIIEPESTLIVLGERDALARLSALL